MATISSPGIGSGLDVKSIVSQLVALEKQPLTKLKVQAATVNTKISAYGQIKSLVSTLSSAAGTLNSLTTWNAVSATSSNAKAVSASAIGGAAANSFSVQVTALAKAQSYASDTLPLPAGTPLGGGTVTIQLGKWTNPSTFAPSVGVAPVDVTVAATDSVTEIASKINSANAGVSATVLNDAAGERLLLRSKSTGEEFGFQLTVADDDTVNTDAAGLSRLVAGASTQYAANAAATINGSIPVTSATNTFANVISGVTLTVAELTTTAAEITISQDKSVITKAIDGFVAAYNAVNGILNEATKYDPATKSAGLLQGDATAIGLQSALRGILQSTTSGSAFARLADIGITQQLGGELAADSTKLNKALENLDAVKSLFRIDNGNPLTNGVALKFKTFSQGLLATDGFFQSKDASLKRSLDLNGKDQQRVGEKVNRVEAQLNRRYSALDVQLSSLNALNAYVTQQVAQWNRVKQ
ncbi:flagellar filament capping protein FliD [Rhodoferax sp.]|uniref:flagellar filament capping protein FliD n=1 Tax=Rhodoferax sp. TaxID=50421 RepID=UPI0027779AFA|nr:flagellar filament capping protein FliD [Rhodoferax sp.]